MPFNQQQEFAANPTPQNGQLSRIFMLRFFVVVGILLVIYDQVALAGKYASTVGKIARLVLLHFGV
jgi:hypothetical protein